MAENIVELLTDVADAIREKKGTTDKINAQNFSDEIKNLPSGASGDVVITSDSDNYYYGSKLNAVIGGSLTIIGNSAFVSDTRLVSVNIVVPITKIDVSAFQGCTGLESINIPNSVTLINNYAFSNCTSLAKIILPQSVAELGSNIFSKVKNMQIVVLRETPAKLWDSTFGSIADSRYIYVPDASLEAYKAATNWAAFADAIRPISELPNE